MVKGWSVESARIVNPWFTSGNHRWMAMYSLVRSQVMTRSRPFSRPSATFQADLWLFHCRFHRRPRHSWSGAHLCAQRGYRQLVAIRRLACLADRHDDAAPIGVLAAIAVFTSGELAIDMAMRRAEAFDTAPSTTISTSLRAPFAIARPRGWRAPLSARLKSFSRGSCCARDRRKCRLGRWRTAWRVIRRWRCSPSTVTALKVSATPSLSNACSAGAAMAA